MNTLRFESSLIHGILRAEDVLTNPGSLEGSLTNPKVPKQPGQEAYNSWPLENSVPTSQIKNTSITWRLGAQDLDTWLIIMVIVSP